ncbi:MAG: S1C family serine protease, partial [Thermogutta sp.]
MMNSGCARLGYRLAFLSSLLATLCASVGRGESPGPPGAEEGMAFVAAMESAIVNAVEKAEKSVVAIARVRVSRPGEVFNLEPRPDLFGQLFAPVPRLQPGDADFVATDYAAGVIVDSDGLVLTLAQVLADDSEYYVTLSDHRVFRASVKAADPRSDLAVLAIPAHDLTPIALGDAGTLRKGQIVIALGNPYAIARDGQVCASWGIVSNLGRKAPAFPSDQEPTGKPTLHHFGTLIQTDARLSFSTNGGALINLRGEMVGMLTALPAVAGFETAAGYAYPVDETFRRVLNHLKRGEEVDYGFLGVQPEGLTLKERASGNNGARVARVIPGAPAERAGLRPNDVITSVNGEKIYDEDGLVLLVGRLAADASVNLEVLREGRRFNVQAKLTKYPVRGKKIVTAPRPKWRGIAVDYVSALTIAPESFWQFPRTLDAVGVVEVDQDSPGW